MVNIRPQNACVYNFYCSCDSRFYAKRKRKSESNLIMVFPLAFLTGQAGDNALVTVSHTILRSFHINPRVRRFYPYRKYKWFRFVFVYVSERFHKKILSPQWKCTAEAFVRQIDLLTVRFAIKASIQGLCFSQLERAEKWLFGCYLFTLLHGHSKLCGWKKAGECTHTKKRC